MKFLLLLGYILCSVPGLAQDTSKQHRIRFGFAVGTTLTNLEVIAYPSTYQGNFENQPPLGFRAGILVSYRFSDRFFLSGQLTYLNTKCSITAETILWNGFTVTGNYKETNQWIEMPIDVNFIINPKSKIKAFVGAGISLMHLATTQANNYTVNSNKFRFNVGALVQVGSDIPIGNHTLRMVVSLDRVLRDVAAGDSYAPSTPYTTVEYEYQYTTLSLTARYLF